MSHLPVGISGLRQVLVRVADISLAASSYERLLARSRSWSGRESQSGREVVVFRLANTELHLYQSTHAEEAGDAGDVRDEGVVMLGFSSADLGRSRLGLIEAGLDPGEIEKGEGEAGEVGTDDRRWGSFRLSSAATRQIPIRVLEEEPPVELAATLAGQGGERALEGAVRSLDHVVVMSPNLDASKRLYEEGLGLRLALDRSFPKRGVRLLFFRVGGTTVEIGGRLAVDPNREDSGDRFGGLAWQVPDAHAAHERLAGLGFDLNGVREGNKPGTRVFTVKDKTHGVPTLIIEPS